MSEGGEEGRGSALGRLHSDTEQRRESKRKALRQDESQRGGCCRKMNMFFGDKVESTVPNLMERLIKMTIEKWLV